MPLAVDGRLLGGALSPAWAAGGQAAGQGVAPVVFEELGPASGVDFVLRNSATPRKYQIEPMIAGRRSLRLRQRRVPGHLPGQRGRDSGAGKDGAQVLQPPLPKPGERDLPRRDAGGRRPGEGLHDGGGGRRLRQRRLAGPLRGGGQSESVVPQQRRRDLLRRDGQGGCGGNSSPLRQDLGGRGRLVRLRQ